MAFLMLFCYFVALILGFVGGANTITPSVRESTVKFCIEKLAECKKEFDFYQMRTEFNASKENK
jgi:hypothetical protein